MERCKGGVFCENWFSHCALCCRNEHLQNCDALPDHYKPVGEQCTEDEINLYGEILKKLREKKNLSIADVAEELVMDKSLIEAMEKSTLNIDLDFIRRYSSMLGFKTHISFS